MYFINLLILWKNGTYSWEAFSSPKQKERYLQENNAEILQYRVEEEILGQ